MSCYPRRVVAPHGRRALPISPHCRTGRPERRRSRSARAWYVPRSKASCGNLLVETDIEPSLRFHARSGIPCTAKNVATVSMGRLLVQVANGGFQDLVAAFPNAAHGGFHPNLRLDAYPLQLTPIRMAHLMAGEGGDDAAGKIEVSDVAIVSAGRRSDEGDVGRRLEVEAGVLRLTAGRCVNEHDHLALIARFAVRLGGLIEEDLQLFPRVVPCRRAEAHRLHALACQARRDRP